MLVMFAAIVFNWLIKSSTDSVILFLERYVLSLVIEKLILLLYPFYQTQHDRVVWKKWCDMKSINCNCFSLISAATPYTQLLIFAKWSPGWHIEFVSWEFRKLTKWARGSNCFQHLFIIIKYYIFQPIFIKSI